MFIRIFKTVAKRDEMFVGVVLCFSIFTLGSATLLIDTESCTKIDLLKVSGNWQRYKLQLKSYDDRFDNVLRSDNFEGSVFIYFDPEENELHLKMFVKEEEPISPLVFGIFHNDFAMQLPGDRNVTEQYRCIGYEQESFIAFQDWTGEAILRKGVLGYVWVFGAKVLPPATVLEIKAHLENVYLKLVSLKYRNKSV